MRRAEGERSKRRWRLVLGWLITALVVAVYFALPGGNDDVQLAPAAESQGERSLEIMEISPARAAPGEALTITYASPGSYSYICAIHQYMTGSVEVVP